MATSKYYYKYKAYLKNYERNMREKGFRRCHIWAKPEQWAVILAFANVIKSLRNPEKIMGIDVLDNKKTIKLVMKDSVKQTDEEFFAKRGGYDYSDIPFLEEGQQPDPTIIEYVKNREN